MKSIAISIIYFFISLLAFSQSADYWNGFNNSKCKELEKIKDIKQTKNDFEFRLIVQGCCWNDSRSDKAIIIKGSEGKLTGQLFYKELLPQNIYSDFKMKKLLPKTCLDTIYNQIITSFLTCQVLPDTMTVVGDTVDGFLLPYISPDDGSTYYFEVKFNNKFFYRSIVNPETKYVGISHFVRPYKNQEIIKVYEVYVNLIRSLRTKFRVEI